MKTTPEIDTTGNPNLIVLDKAAQAAALKLAKSDYQIGILTGRQCLSGADLKGKAKRFGLHYAKSRGAILSRVRAAGIAIREVIGAKNKRILVIG